MIPVRNENWEEEIPSGLSPRAVRIGVAYVGPGSGGDLLPSKGPDRPPIPFTGGIPDPATLPITELSAAAGRVFSFDGHDALQYGGSQGYLKLREWLAGHWTKIDGIDLTPANFCLTNGSAHALANICDTFVGEGDVVLVESPSFPGSIRAISSFGCRVEAIPMDVDGALPEALEDKLRSLSAEGLRAKLLYLIPNFHNPTGACMPIERRRRILDLCEQHNVLIIEDDAYGEMRFDETQPPSLFSMARGRGVIKAGSFSKIIAPGMRVGWCLASPAIVTALLATRFDMGQSPVINRMIYEYAKDGALDDHIVAMRAVYRQKRDVMMNELAERCSHLATWSEPHGGFFAWLKLHESIDAQRLQQYVVEEGVTPVFGPSFFVPNTPGAEPDRYIRLAYSYTAQDQIAEGIRRLARAIERARR